MTNEQLYKAACSVFAYLEPWKDRCHEASLKLVRSGKLPDEARVARGWCVDEVDGPVIPSQHSWVCIGDPYDDSSIVVDPTRMLHTNEFPRVWVGYTGDGGYHAHGKGWAEFDGVDFYMGGPTVELGVDWSDEAEAFLMSIAPLGLDLGGWFRLANCPVEGWPSQEILGAIAKDPQAQSFVPIDVQANLLGTNPSELYQ